MSFFLTLEAIWPWLRRPDSPWVPQQAGEPGQGIAGVPLLKYRSLAANAKVSQGSGLQVNAQDTLSCQSWCRQSLEWCRHRSIPCQFSGPALWVCCHTVALLCFPLTAPSPALAPRALARQREQGHQPVLPWLLGLGSASPGQSCTVSHPWVLLVLDLEGLVPHPPSQAPL